jgi:hypothetical protein
MPLFAPEVHFKKMMLEKFNRPVTVGRVANLSQPQEWHTKLGGLPVNIVTNVCVDVLIGITARFQGQYQPLI